MLLAFLRTIWTVMRKDIRIWLRQPANMAATIVPPIGFLLVEALGAAAVGRSPVALVRLDNGPKAIEMAQIFHNADIFRITDATPQQAQSLYNNIQVVAIITIPANFTQNVDAHASAPITVTVNNLNLDFTNDIRRSVPDAITQFYHAEGSGSPIQVTLHEQDLRSQDVQFFEYSVLPTIVLLLTIGGLITGGLAAAREWETRTVKELLLSPTTRTAIILGKVLAGFVTTSFLGTLVLVLATLLNWIHPVGLYWLTSLAIIALVALFSSGLGVAIGALIQRIQPVIAISVNVALYLFFLAGGIGVIAFEPLFLQNIAVFIPLTYGNHALEQAVFYSSADQLGRDVLILGSCAAASVCLGIYAMRRGIAR
jgi:ABC-2 type transport system permease protein